MTDHQPLPVSGYTPQSDEKVRLVNEFKQDEERLLRKLDDMTSGMLLTLPEEDPRRSKEEIERRFRSYDQRWLAIARTHINEAFMALNRAIFQPTRIKLPEDGE